MKNVILSSGVVAVLGACGGGGDSERNFSSVERDTLNLASDLSQFDISPVETLPTVGSASYAGKVGFAEPGYAVIGDLNIGVNFGTEAITGNATNFIDSDNDAYTGSLTVGNGSFDRNADPDLDYQFAADMNGVINGAGGNYLIQSTLEGDFLGANQEGIAGVANGTISTATGAAFISGDFGAKRQ